MCIYICIYVCTHILAIPTWDPQIIPGLCLFWSTVHPRLSHTLPSLRVDDSEVARRVMLHTFTKHVPGAVVRVFGETPAEVEQFMVEPRDLPLSWFVFLVHIQSPIFNWTLF